VFRALALATVVAGVALLGGCALSPFSGLSSTECMARVMYFESNRSSAEGMLAVGTVVMNRVHDPKFPSTVCGVVGQRNQFADGVLWKPVKEGKSIALARQVADRVLRGARHPGVRSAKFFHTQGYSFPYTNMHYVLNAGGNSFYEKR
jgi:spore germination cell wall hydrolase CwlJ-like protein